MSGSQKPKRSDASWELTMFLTKPTVTRWQQALVDPRQLPPHEDIAGVGTLVIKEAPLRTPWWVERLGDRSALVRDLRQQSPGAVLFVRAKSRLFALTFGYGRSLLAPDRLVHDFGVRVVLNTVDPSLLRSIDVRTLEAEPLLSKKQFAEGRPLASFGVDTYRDVLRGVTGRETKDAPLVSGSSAVHLRAQLRQLGDLEAECGRMLEASSKATYRKDFAWIDHVRLVRDPSVKLALERALHEECSSSAMSDVRFLVPDVREGHQLGRLRGSWARRAASALDISAVRARLKHRASGRDATRFLRAVKADHVCEPSLESDALTQRWPLFDCILWTVTTEGVRYVLTSGEWFELDGAFISEVETAFDKMVARGASVALPPATALPIPSGSYYEREYNKRAASTGLQLLDRTNMMDGLGASNVEPCDVLDAERGIFVHVKDGRSSSMLSHLFNQGTVSLEGFLSVADARTKVRRLAGVEGRHGSALSEPIRANRLTVVFAVIDKPPSRGPWRLPFFSMLAAKHAAERVERLHAVAQVVRIDDQRS